MCVCVYLLIAHNRAIRPCHPSHYMPLALILPLCVCVLSSHLFWTSGFWMYQPGSHRRKATQDFSTFECFYDSPPPNRRLHETENKEFSPLQAAKLKNQCVINMYLQQHPHKEVGPANKLRMREKRRGIGLETVAGMGGGYRRNTPSFCGACLIFLSREGFSCPFPSPTVKSIFFNQRIIRSPPVGRYFLFYFYFVFLRGKIPVRVTAPRSNSRLNVRRFRGYQLNHRGDQHIVRHVLFLREIEKRKYRDFPCYLQP